MRPPGLGFDCAIAWLADGNLAPAGAQLLRATRQYFTSLGQGGGSLR